MSSYLEFLSEIQSDFSSFDSQDIDPITVKRLVVNELKRFGADILERRETILNVKNSQTMLPQNFRSLRLALLLDPKGYHCDGDIANVENSYIYKQRIENPAYYEPVSGEYVLGTDTKMVTETITINNTALTFYHGCPKFLSLVEGIKKDVLSVDCVNVSPFIRNNARHEISITGNQINTSFKEGSIYIQYNSLPADEDGEIEIPETNMGFLEKYLEYYVKSRIAENLIANNKNPQALAQLLPMYRQEAQNYLSLALRESKFKGLGKHWVKRYKLKNHRDMAIFKLPTLTRIADPRFY